MGNVIVKKPHPLIDPRSSSERGEGRIFDYVPIIGTKEKFNQFKQDAVQWGEDKGLLRKLKTPVPTSQGEKTGEDVSTPYDMFDWLRNLAREKKPPPPPPPPPKYDLAADEAFMKDWVRRNQGNIEKWTGDRPSVKRSYDDLLGAVNEGRIGLKAVPKDEWDDWKKSHNVQENAGGWYQDFEVNDKFRSGTIHYPEGEFGRVGEKNRMGQPKQGLAPHEIMHFFAGHKPTSAKGGHDNVPDINPYQALDMKLGGWLPSFHPGGRRPWTPKSDEEYHPWFDEVAYDRAASWDNPEHSSSREKTFQAWNTKRARRFRRSPPGRLISNAFRNARAVKHHLFPTPYMEPPPGAATFDDYDFNQAFKVSREAGQKTFNWRGKEYTTETK